METGARFASRSEDHPDPPRPTPAPDRVLANRTLSPQREIPYDCGRKRNTDLVKARVTACRSLTQIPKLRSRRLSPKLGRTLSDSDDQVGAHWMPKTVAIRESAKRLGGVLAQPSEDIGPLSWRFS